MKIQNYVGRVLVLVVSVVLLSQCAPGQDRPVTIPGNVDPEQFDILGLRLHMNATEALDIVEKRFNVKPASICSGNSIACLLVQESHGWFTPGKPFVNEIQLHQPTFTLAAEFIEIYPYDSSHREMLVNVSYQALNLEHEPDFEAFQREVLAKYGPPPYYYDLEHKKGPLWCNKGFPQEVGYAPDQYHSPILDLSGAVLRLRFDPSEIEAEQRRLLEQQRTNFDRHPL